MVSPSEVEKQSCQEHTAFSDLLWLISPDPWGVLRLAEGLGRDVLLQGLVISRQGLQQIVFSIYRNMLSFSLEKEQEGG